MSTTATVGRRSGQNCQNRAADQRTIADLLNAIPAAQGGAGGALRNDPIDGICSDALYASILAFQRRHPELRADGHINANGPTLRLLLALRARAGGARPAASPITPLAGLPGANSPAVSRETRIAPWNDLKARARRELAGDPNLQAILTYLTNVERTAGQEGPVLREWMAFGEFAASPAIADYARRNAYPILEHQRLSTAGGMSAVIIIPGEGRSASSFLLVAEHTLLVRLGRFNHQMSRRPTAADTRVGPNLRGALGRLAGR